MAAKTEALPKPPTPFKMDSCVLIEQRQQRWFLTARDCPREDITNPERWSVLAQKLKPFDMVEFVVQGAWGEALVSMTDF